MRRLLSSLAMVGLLSSSVIAADCPNDVYDYDSGRFLSHTDVKERCEKAVNSAVEKAVKGTIEKACSEGYKKCRDKCSDKDCEDACEAGKKGCEGSL